MSRFTEFVRKYADRADVSQQDFDDCLGELARAVRARLERLGMFALPPAFFGYGEFATWDRALDLTDGPTDPVLDAFDAAITTKLDLLAERLETGSTPNIDGLVLLNVNHFLYDRQRLKDPVGHAVFENLQAALLSLARAGSVTLEGLVDGAIRNSTIVRFRAGPTATTEEIEHALDAEAELGRLYPHLSHANTRAQAVLADLLTGLDRSSLRSCLFRDLVGALKERVRAAHTARNRPPDHEVMAEGRRVGEDAELIRIVRPDTSYSDREQYEAFLRQVRAGIATLPQERTRRGVARLFDEVVRYREVDEELPTVEELGRRLGLARSTVHEHLQKLREIVRAAGEGP
jgi:hypothetical protein